MYESWFGLREAAFALTPNTRFYLPAESHRQALEVLTVALGQAEGIIKITGEVGTGKTLLCRMLLNHLEGKVVTAYLPNPRLEPNELYSAVADELGLGLASGESPHRILAGINQHLIHHASQGRSVVLLIDEAQAMPEATIEALRLLTNLETESRKLLQIVLFGQPELNRMLNRDSLRQLKQRISFHCRLAPLDRRAVGDYLGFRLGQAGYRGDPVFSSGAVRLITRASGGIPRLVNLLAHKAMLAAWGRGDTQVGRWHVRRAVKDTESARPLGFSDWGLA